MKYGFIGCGNMGGALAAALSKATKDIMLADKSTDMAKQKANELGVKSGSNEDVINNCERVFFGIKPQFMESTVKPLAALIKEKKPLIITMAAGLKIEKFKEFIGEEMPTVRIMPNTPVALGKGVILYCKNDLVSEETVKDFCFDMRFGGLLDSLDEKLIDAGCSLSGCGPAFVYMFCEALADGGVACGLPRDKAIKYAAMTISGSAEMLLQSGKHPGELKDNVCSPGGSTIEGVKALENGAFRAAAIDAVTTAFKKNIELGK